MDSALRLWRQDDREGNIGRLARFWGGEAPCAGAKFCLAEVPVRVVLRLSGDAEASDMLKAVTLSGSDFVIGRDGGCDWPISDGLSMMSRRHCVLQLNGDRVLLTDLSSNGTSVGSPSNRLVQGQPMPLPDTATLYLAGEHVRIDYECHREEAPTNTDDVWGVDEIRRNRGGAQVKKHNPADDSLDLLGDDDADRNDPLSLALDDAQPAAPMADVLSLDDRPAPRGSPPEPRREEDRSSFATAQAASAPAEDLFSVDDSGDDGDPFADLSGGGKPSARDDLSLDDASRARSASDDLSLDTPPPARPAQDDLSLDVPPPRAAPSSDSLPLDEAPQAPPRKPRTVFSPSPRPTTRVPQTVDPAPPRPSAPEAAAQPVTSAPQPAPAPANDQSERALAALFDALGIPVEDIPLERRRQTAAEIGRSFRALADGMRELLESRRDVKIALGLGATQVETGANPLKFVRDANGAVDAILRPSASGYLSGVAAVEDSVKALQKHQVALVGGVKVSMKTALAAFNPAALEKKLEKKGISALIAMKRKAELWERFVENYAEFAEEADDNIKRLISKDLERLYADEASRSRASLDI